MTAVTPMQVVEQARTLLGVPFSHQGRSARGVDCAGLVVLVAQALGLSRFDVAGYPRTPDGHSLRAALLQAGCRPAPVQVGALLLMRFEREPQHLGLVTPYAHGGLGLVHAYSLPGRVVEHVLDHKWQRRVVQAWALPGVAYPTIDVVEGA